MKPDNIDMKNSLRVTGQGLTPQSSRSASPEVNKLIVWSSSNSCVSDDRSEESREYTVLDGVRDMNEMLEKQVKTIRQQIAFNEQNYNNEAAKILQATDSEIRQRDGEIDDLRESLTDRDENIQLLQRINAEKDTIIKVKSLEIEDLKKIVDQIKENIRKIQQQMRRNQRVTKAGKREDVATFKEKSEEIALLNGEMEQLQVKSLEVGQELAKAIKAIEQQNESLKTMDEEKVSLLAKFKEDLNKTSKAMRQDIERMTEVIWQNIGEMKELQENNKAMQNEINEIKRLIETSGTMRKISQTEHDQGAIDNLPSSTSNRQLSEQITLDIPTAPRETARPQLPSSKAVNSKLHSEEMHTLPPMKLNHRLPTPNVRASCDFPINMVRRATFHVKSISSFKSNGSTTQRSIRDTSRQYVNAVGGPFPKGQTAKADSPIFILNLGGDTFKNGGVSPRRILSRAVRKTPVVRKGGNTNLKRGTAFKK